MKKLFIAMLALSAMLMTGRCIEKVKAVATLHRNKTKITEDECTLAYTLFLRTDAGILSASDSFSLIRLIGFESEEAAEKSLMLYDGDNFELEWTLTRR